MKCSIAASHIEKAPPVIRPYNKCVLIRISKDADMVLFPNEKSGMILSWKGWS